MWRLKKSPHSIRPEEEARKPVNPAAVIDPGLLRHLTAQSPVSRNKPPVCAQDWIIHVLLMVVFRTVCAA